MNIAVGLSGGIDSAVAAKLLIDQGHSVCGVTFKLLSGQHNEAANGKILQEAAQIAAFLGIPHRIYDFREAFRTSVIEYFIESYRKGETPNPCYICNKEIKFGLFLQQALAEGFDAVATGHYAGIVRDSDGRFLLKQARDLQKDQSYFLALLNQQQLSRIMFPLADMTKSEIRSIAQAAGLANAQKPDSQDICFVPDGNYAAVIEAESHEAFPAGDFIHTDGTKAGTHKGLHHYTIGQRRGLALAFGRPVYVVAKSAAANTVTVGTAEALCTPSCIVHTVNWIAREPAAPIPILVKTRYRQAMKKARLIPLSHESVKIIFDEPERAVAPGQAAVFYRQEDSDAATVLGGGIIGGV